MRTRTIFVVLLLMAAAGVLAAPQAPKGKAAVPRDPERIDAQGFQRVLEKYRGQPLLVNFWATWCEPCRHEYPMLSELAAQYAPQGLKVVGISMDDEGDVILMRRFLARYKPVFPNYWKNAGAEAEFRSVVQPGWNGSLPVSFFYGKDGDKVGQVMGEGTRETYETAIRALLAGAAK